MASESTFEVTVPPDADVGETLLVGVADLGVAGLTAVDYLTSHVETTQIGHVRTGELPAIAPFSEGQPRRPMRLYSSPGTPTSVFVSEVFVPVTAASTLARTLCEWASDNGVREIAVLFGAPFPHSEAEHDVYHVATDAVRERRFADSDIEPLTRGYFDGVVGELVTQGLDEDGPPVGVLVTPAHHPGPDLDGALRLLDGLERVYGVSVDETELRERSEEMKQYYQELADRMQSLQEAQPQEYLEDRMYM